MSPLISVVVPVYNVAPWLRRCVESLLAQTVSDFEIILVNDGSTDESLQICDDLAACDTRITVIDQPNRGLSAARRTGFTLASGEFIAFVDSDDYVSPGFLARLSHAMNRHDAQLGICGYTHTDGHRSRTWLPPYDIEVVDDAASNYIAAMMGPAPDRSSIYVPGFMCIRMFRRSLIKMEYFVSEREVFAEDIVFNLLYADAVERIAVVREPLYWYWRLPTSLSNRYHPNKWNMLQSLNRFREEYARSRDLADRCHDRLVMGWVSSVYSAVDNLVASDDRRLFMWEIRQISANVDVQKAIAVPNRSSLSRMQSVLLWLFRKEMFRTIYILRRIRSLLP